MKFKITPNTITYPEVQEKLQAKFPQYTFKMRGKQFLVCSKSSSIGANIVIRKKNFNVVGNFPTMGGTMIFVLSLFLLGILIPLIVYFVAFHSKMKVLENEIGAFLKEEYELK
jgi:hypothetical protein